ncbi:FecR protein [Chryseobacterium taichungense]|uniref:FecR protein n=1 Tax=Chryseobacterium taichungense TaxID=295069 RepID=A0A1H7VYL6_9FLAO|nr:FecR family protein [Chryseobacterium taichungense]SEM13877.1 FecR protein [Chryseobacterium taichungense]
MDYKEECDAIRIGELVAKKLHSELSEKEEELMNRTLDQHPEYRNVYQFLAETEKDNLFDQMQTYDSDAALKRVLDRYNKPRKKKTRLIWYAAASLIIFLSLGGYWMISIRNISDGHQITSQYGDDVISGILKPKMILSDGSSYELDTAQSGIRINENGIQYDNGVIIVSEKASVSVTLVTPKGRQYRITLPDGTKSVLNAATSLTYPSQFTAKERLVELQGEAYFEVAHNAAKPFRVKSTGQQILVLGTKFNVSAYPAEKPVTTLIEGKVSLRSENVKEVFLAPGQQSELGKEAFKVQDVQPDDYLSWMKGEFVFNNMALDQVFNVLERWYDVTFEYPPGLSQQYIYAEITRKHKLSEVLNILERVTGLAFKIEERRVIVKK